MGIFSDIGGFLSDAASVVKPIANIGYSLYSANQQANAQNNLVDYYKQREDQNFKNYQEQAAYEAALAAAGGSGGGGGGGSRGPSPAQIQQMFDARIAANDEIKSMYAPYVEAGHTVLPQMTQAYGSGANGLQSLFANMVTPEKLANAARTPINPQDAKIRLPGRLR